MRVLIQRVSNASVTINEVLHSSIANGLLVLCGFEEHDLQEDVIWMCSKISNLRIFSDEDGKMNLSLLDIKGEVLIVSQFTLHALTKKGNRPSFIHAAKPEQAIPLHEQFIDQFKTDFGIHPKTGVFGADMKVALVNDGPVTIWIDSKNRE